MTASDLATALDYADALAVARKAKAWLAAALAALLLGELALFFAYRYGAAPPAGRAADLLKYAVGLIDFLGVVVPLLLAVDLLLIANVMLVGRLIGVSSVVSAFLWCTALIALLFPWQAFLANATFTSAEFKVPGALYTWEELVARGRFESGRIDLAVLWLRWARFVVFPLLSIGILLAVQLKSSRGLKLALGDAPPSPGDLPAA